MSHVLTPRRIERYGWRRSLPDARDHIADTSGIKILDEVDPRKDMPPIYDQGQEGSCTAHAVRRVIDYDRHLHTEKLLEPSRTAIYWFERMLEGSPLDQDTGAEGRDGFKAAQNFGLPTERLWPYVMPTDPHYAEDPRKHVQAASFIKLERPYKSVPQTDQDIKAALSNKQMIAVGATLYEGFESTAVERTGIVSMPKRNEQIIGGHEFVVIGYLKAHPNYYLCANSWGSKNTDGVVWGLDGEGCFLIPIPYIISSTLTGDLRTIPRPLGA